MWVVLDNGKKISIHALREEGDLPPFQVSRPELKFLSTPSVRRATCNVQFLQRGLFISIHALREEGDRHRKGHQPQ